MTEGKTLNELLAGLDGALTLQLELGHNWLNPEQKTVRLSMVDPVRPKRVPRPVLPYVLVGEEFCSLLSAIGDALDANGWES